MMSPMSFCLLVSPFIDSSFKAHIQTVLLFFFFVYVLASFDGSELNVHIFACLK